MTPEEKTALTRAQALLEHHAVVTDPNHPMYWPYRRNDPAASAYIASMYETIPGKLVIGDGIVVERRTP